MARHDKRHTELRLDVFSEIWNSLLMEVESDCFGRLGYVIGVIGGYDSDKEIYYFENKGDK